jgi:PAS domain S-box-containing protein
VDKESHIFQARVAAPPGAEESRREARARERLSYLDLHRRLLELYAPPSVLVNAEHEIVHLSETAGRYLSIPGGEPSYNLLMVVLPELRLELRGALFHAAQLQTNVEVPGLPVRVGDRVETVNLVVRPVVRKDDTSRGFYLVVFKPAPEMAVGGAEDLVLRAAEPVARQLTEEVSHLQTQLRTTVEQYEVQHEELCAEESLREARQSLEFALNAARLGAWDVDLTTGRARTSLLHSQIFGYAEPVTEWGPEVFREHVLPEDREVFESAFARALESRVLDLQVRVRRADGSVRWIHDHGRVYYGDDGRPLRMAGVTLDVTERKDTDALLSESRERMRLLLESTTDYAILTTDAGGRIENWNSGAERIIGYTAEEAVGRHTRIIFTPEDNARGAAEEEMRIAREQGRATDERWHLRKDGSRFYASGVLSPLGDRPDSGFVKIMRDLTEQKRADEELRSAHEELERRVSERTDELRHSVETMLTEVKERRAAEEHARALVGQLVTAQEDERRRISRDLHDQLGQQLTALRLKLAALRNECGQDVATRSRIEEVQAIAERIDSEVDFLAWELRPTALDDLGLTAALTNFVREWSSHYHIPAEAHVTGFNSGAFRLSPQAETCLYRITQEALTNVYKHAQAARVSVILERRDGDAVLVIEDDGVGFDASTAAGWEGGRGLGLVGMRERAALLGGSVEFESAPGKGTTIFARIPINAKHAGGGGGNGE